MARHQDATALRSINALLVAGTAAGLDDAQLIGRFTSRDGEAAELAFATLVERHGPMVLRVCRGVLRDPHDADDAFQATFLVLARKAGSIRERAALGPWLHGVAYNVATTARAAAARRRSHERRAAAGRPIAEEPAGGDDLAPALHEELARLPGRYRAAVVLCLLEGLTREQAAARLGLPTGTVQSRLARGREQLRVRLARRGLAPAAALATASAASEAAVPAALATSTIRAATRFAAGDLAAGAISASAITLAKGALRAMRMTRLMTAGMSGLLLGAAVTGAGVLAQSGGEPDPAAARPEAEDSALKFELRVWRGEELVGSATETHFGTPQGRLMRLATREGVFELRPVARPVRVVIGSDDHPSDMEGSARPLGSVGDVRATAGPPPRTVAQSPEPVEPVQIPGPEPTASVVRYPRSRRPASGITIPQVQSTEPAQITKPRLTDPASAIGSLDRRMTGLEKKLDRILRALERAEDSMEGGSLEGGAMERVTDPKELPGKTKGPRNSDRSQIEGDAPGPGGGL